MKYFRMVHQIFREKMLCTTLFRVTVLLVEFSLMFGNDYLHQRTYETHKIFIREHMRHIKWIFPFQHDFFSNRGVRDQTLFLHRLQTISNGGHLIFLIEDFCGTFINLSVPVLLFHKIYKLTIIFMK